MSVKKRVISIILCMICVLSTVMSGTYAWRGTASARNEFTDTRSIYNVTLEKQEKDIDGTETGGLVPNAEFYLYRILSTNPEVTEQVGLRHQTDGTGQIKVEDLSEGSYYFLETNPSYAYDYDKQDDNVTAKTRYDFVVDGTKADGDGVVGVKAYNRKMTAPLNVTKTVENSDASALTEEQKDVPFTFKVIFDDGKIYPYIVTKEGEAPSAEQTLVNNVFTLKHGETAMFTNVPIGVAYTVTETPVAGYEITSDGHTGNMVKEGNAANFTNRFIKTESDKLIITKTVIGTTDDGKLNTAFTFIVTFGKADNIDPDILYDYDVYKEGAVIGSGSIKSGEEITLTHGQSAVFGGLPIGEEYHVSEKATAETVEYITHVTEQNGHVIVGGSQVDFINGAQEEESTGKLIVTKEVVIGEAEIPPATPQKFDFTIVVGEGSEEAIYTCALEDGESYEVPADILVGTHYRVIENNYSSEGYVTTNTGSQGTIVEGENRAVFTNTLTTIEEGEKGILRLEKEVAGESIDTEKVFDFMIVIGDEPPQEVHLKHGEYEEFPDIEVGTHYHIYEKNYSHEGYATTSTGATGTITKETVVAKFTNTYEEPNSEIGILEISKTVSGDGDIDKDFTFKVKFDGDEDNKTHLYTIEGLGTPPRQLEDGRLTLKHDQKAIFMDVPIGTAYEVEEQAETGYLQGTIKKGGIIKAGLNTVAFNNYLPPTNETGILIVKKVVTGDGADLDKAFDFILKVDGVVHEDGVFSLKHGETEEIEVPIGLVYELSEVNYISDGYALRGIDKGHGSTTKETIEIVAENAYVEQVFIDLGGEKTWEIPAGTELPESITVYLMDGKRKVAMATADANTNWKYSFPQVPMYNADLEEIEYTVAEEKVVGYRAEVTGLDIKNVYTPVTIADPPVTKIVMGKPDTRDAFIFEMVAITKDAPMPAGAIDGKLSMVIEGMGTKDFGDIVYDTVGVYEYEIREVNDGIAGYTYDEAVYSMTITVTELGDGTLKHVINFKKQGESVEEIVFNNIYNEPDDITPTPPEPTTPPVMVTPPITATPTPPTTATPTPPETATPKPSVTKVPPVSTTPTRKPITTWQTGDGNTNAKQGMAAKTGDNTQLLLLLSLVGFSGIVAVVLIARKKKQEK